MAVQPEGFEYMEAVVTDVKGVCHAGHKKGEKLQLGCFDPGGLCGFFYHDIFPALSVMQFGGKYPWNPDQEMTLRCPDHENQVTLKIVRKD